MAIRRFLAMTAAEIQNSDQLPEKIAWLACHFSPYGRGLSNLPRTLPPDCLLVVDDITPMHGHDPEYIAQQLTDCVNALDCAGVLLDFQRPGNDEASTLVRFLSSTLPCFFSVSERYAEGGSFPVFLSPVPPSVPLREHLEPWKGREIWLDISSAGEVRRLSEEGCTCAPLSPAGHMEPNFDDPSLHCHYQMHLTENCAEFTLWRTREDLDALLVEAQELGITTAVGLYQELRLLGI